MTAPGNITDVINLAARIQRRRDFAAHAVGFATGATLILLVHALDPAVSGGWTALLAVLAWAVALSFQHFRQVIRGPVTAEDLDAEAHRHQHESDDTGDSAGRVPNDGADRERDCGSSALVAALWAVLPGCRGAVGRSGIAVDHRRRPGHGIAAGDSVHGGVHRPRASGAARCLSRQGRHTAPGSRPGIRQ